jgi:hypothetical protein
LTAQRALSLGRGWWEPDLPTGTLRSEGGDGTWFRGVRGATSQVIATAI